MSDELNLTWHAYNVARSDREKLNGHRGATVWLTGLSGSGKSTLANALAMELHRLGVHTYVLDGDNVRHGLNKDLGFEADERVENIRRIGEVARLFSEAGIVNITAFISPYRSDRDLARHLQGDGGSFIEVHVATDVSVCEARDPKGLYKKARAGEIPNFTGIDSPYEPPDRPEVVVDAGELSVDDCIARIVEYLKESGTIRMQLSE